MYQKTDKFFTSFDSTELFYRSWLPSAQSSPQKAVIIFHRGHEHSGRLDNLVQELNLPDTAFFAWDQRGHGKSPGTRGFAPHLTDIVRDMDAFVSHISTQYIVPIENIVVIGHSLAAVFVALWVKNYAPKIRGMVLATPAFKVKLYVPLALFGLRVWYKATQVLGLPTPFIKSYVKGKLLTHDKKEASDYDNDPLISKQIAVNILLDLFEASKQLLSDAGAIITPTLLLSARADWVVKNKPQRDFFQKISSPFKRVKVFKDMYHALFHEKGRAPVVDAVRNFIEEVSSKKIEILPLTEADSSGYTYEEYEWLRAGLPLISLKRLFYQSQVFAMKNLGFLSKGIEIGLKYGFDSGESLDHVYRNEPQGKNALGKFIDKGYLNAIGWRGIRQRKLNLEKLLTQAIKETGAPCVRIVDLAGGPGRYVLDVIKTRPVTSYDVLIRDFSQSGLAKGQELATSMNLSTVRYEQGDAFNESSLGSIAPKADIAIVSGLYELFPANQPIKDSLRGITQFLKPGGYLLYTNQPWHPQLEMIAETLPNREGKAWIMRRRTQAEMDQLVAQAGFKKIAMEIDNFGIFTVSLAVLNG